MNCWKALRNRRLFLEKLRSSMNDLVIAPCLGWPRSLCENFMWLSMAVPSSERRPSFRLGYGLTDRPALHFQYYFSVRASGTETEKISWARISVGRSPRCCEIISWICSWRVSSHLASVAVVSGTDLQGCQLASFSSCPHLDFQLKDICSRSDFLSLPIRKVSR